MDNARLSTSAEVQKAIYDLILPNLRTDPETKQKLCNFIGTYLHIRPTDPVIDVYATKVLSSIKTRFSIAYQALWLRRNDKFVEQLTGKLASLEPKPFDFGDIASDYDLKSQYVEAWIAWSEQFEMKPVDDAIGFDEVFSIIQELKTTPAVNAAPKYKNWALIREADEKYIMLNTAFLDSFETSKKELLEILGKYNIRHYVTKGTQSHLRLINEAYPNLKITGVFSMMNVKALDAMSDRGHHFAPAIQEFIQSTEIPY
jgi:hypothetical protein